MKKVFSISLDQETIDRIHKTAKKRAFRNKSHLVEEAILKFLEGQQ